MDWLEDREQFLSEVLRLEGRGGASEFCLRCQNGSLAEYRCLDCDGNDLICKACILALHERCSLHRPEVRLGACYVDLITHHHVRNGVLKDSLHLFR